ncbi:hypothetical protein [Thermococcus sp. GR4]|uniref:hypothetical protein n=1 Tax=Thermococcus sp. GR4 TaxID=1638254 RepID=UPI00142F5A72|nr:hypothetical protein [Thermococcus sp. GR4]NJE79417.1 hypothetical protein [Thermococcus sp. GR4]
MRGMTGLRDIGSRIYNFVDTHFHFVCISVTLVVWVLILFVYPKSWQIWYNLIFLDANKVNILDKIISISATLLGFAITTASIFLVIFSMPAGENKVLEYVQQHEGKGAVFTTYVLLALFSAINVISGIAWYLENSDNLAKIFVASLWLEAVYLVVSILFLLAIVHGVLSYPGHKGKKHKKPLSPKKRTKELEGIALDNLDD